MIDLAAALEAGDLAQALRRSRWVYPLVNAGHILGLALLIGAVIPMDIAALRGRRLALLPFAAFGLALAMACGALLFIVQAGDYLASGWFRLKLGLLGAALLNAALYLRRPSRPGAALSLALWPAVLVSGRMIAYG